MTLKLSAEITHSSDIPILSYGVSFTAMGLTSLCKAVYNRVMTQKGTEMITTNIETAREIDGRLADLHDRRYRISRQLNPVLDRLRRWGMTLDDARTNLSMTRDVEWIDRKMTELDEIGIQIDATEAEYTGWNRFFFVQHLHNTTECSSFRWNTRIVWCPEISGLTEEEAVAEYGATLCTKCFKSAPTQ